MTDFNDTTDHEVKADLIEIAAYKYKEGLLTRRGFLSAMAALGVLPALGSKAMAQANEIIVVNWGGKASEVLQEVMCDTYTKETGIPVTVDGSGPSGGKIRAMVESGAVVWDVCDSGMGTALILTEQGVIQPINYDIVDKSKVLEQSIYSHGVGNYIYSYVLATNPRMLGGNVPQSWEDVWNVKDFPGMRTFRKSVRGMLESATMAQGVAPEEVYDVLSTQDGIDAAIDKFRQLRENIIVWGSGSASQNLFLQEEVAMGNIWSTRAHLLKDQMEEGSFQVSFDGGVLAPGVWVVPKDNPAGSDEAMKFIAHAQDPELQVQWLEMIGCGPANPEAADMVPPELQKWNPSSPENLAKQIFYNDEWYAKNQVAAEEAYVDALIN
ncbi:ABC transporter substrate-binding protein [Roseovarius sp. SCSIO 43702]|uniref:ABC transporter substrate-binding protein n=1 Tax=Roseovarius sp. SCSIO 43702 TaxID=2823043 RepID=UPI001C72DF6F|nr:ABC transporter substrate-binding protein [Roseovarius sp. SCSIO 43702]QYX56181.1 ABC transporter substrate-binding protein [Roseovarius sp. SCSIO 43702]